MARGRGRARQPARRNDSDRTPPGAAASHQLAITVASFSTGDSLDFSRELALSKAAVLYGDRATLVGPKVTMLSYVERLRSGSPQEREELFLRMLRAFPPGATALKQLEELGRQPQLRGHVALARTRLVAQAQ